jgi:hypothetical protein
MKVAPRGQGEQSPDPSYEYVEPLHIEVATLIFKKIKKGYEEVNVFLIVGC